MRAPSWAGEGVECTDPSHEQADLGRLHSRGMCKQKRNLLILDSDLSVNRTGTDRFQVGLALRSVGCAVSRKPCYHLVPISVFGKWVTEATHSLSSP